MSATNQTAGPSTDHFTAIFNVASTEYQTVTGNRLDAHPLAAQLNACHNPEDISNLLRTQAHAFSKSRRGDEKLMIWLDPIVHILFVSSATLGEGIALVSFMHSVLLPSDSSISAIFTRKDHFHWNWCSPRGESPSKCLDKHLCDIELLGGEQCCGKPRQNLAPL